METGQNISICLPPTPVQRSDEMRPVKTRSQAELREKMGCF